MTFSDATAFSPMMTDIMCGAAGPHTFMHLTKTIWQFLGIYATVVLKAKSNENLIKHRITIVSKEDYEVSSIRIIMQMSELMMSSPHFYHIFFSLYTCMIYYIN